MVVVNLWHVCQSWLFVVTESSERFTITVLDTSVAISIPHLLGCTAARRVPLWEMDMRPLP